ANLSPGDLGFAVLALAVLPAVFKGARLPPSRIWLAMAAAVFGFGVATVTSMDPSTSMWGFVRYVEIFVVVPVAVVLAVRDRRDRARRDAGSGLHQRRWRARRHDRDRNQRSGPVGE